MNRNRTTAKPKARKASTVKHPRTQTTERTVARPRRPKAAAADDDDDPSGLDSVDPSTHPARDATHFRRIRAAVKAQADADAELAQAVAAAREAGDSWVTIGVALGSTKQNAYQRFGRTR